MSSLYEQMLSTLDKAAEMMGYGRNDYETVRHPERELSVSVPVKMDNGDIKVFEGWRVQHSTVRGPAKGGIRFHQDTDHDEVRTLAAWMSLKCSVAAIPYGGGKGGIRIDPNTLSRDELERMSRAYMKKIASFIGPEKDIPAPDVNTTGEIMGWMLDTYNMTAGKSCPGVITGKPIELGGSLGRTEATGRGVMFCVREIMKCLGKDIKDVKIAVQGMGNVGGIGAKLMFEQGAKIVAISDVSGSMLDDKGLNIVEIVAYLQAQRGRLLKDYAAEKGMKMSDGKEVLYADCDVLVPAALEKQITAENASKIKASVIAEGANGPTTFEADQILEKAGKYLIPDILCNSGGVIVSYFEWVQNLANFYWTEEEVNVKLENQITVAFKGVWELAQSKKCSLRLAAYMVALERIVKTGKMKGI